MTNLMPVANKFNVVTAEIDVSDDDDLSDPINLGGRMLVGIIMPAAWTGAPSITYQASANGTTYAALYNDAGTQLGITTPVAGAFYAIAMPVNFAAVRYLKIAVSVAQAADRTFTLVLVDPN